MHNNDVTLVGVLVFLLFDLSVYCLAEWITKKRTPRAEFPDPQHPYRKG